MKKNQPTTELEQDVEQTVETVPEKKESWTGFFIFLGILIVLFIGIMVLNNVVFMHVEVDGISMENTLKDGDILIANKKRTPNYGDIVIISGEKSNSDLLIKRVIAKGGDELRIENGKVYRKKKGEEEFKELKENYAKGETKYDDSYELKVFIIPEGEIFYMGDNREHSNDSRGTFLTCKESQVVAVVENWSLSLRGVNAFLGKVFSPRRSSD